MISSGDRSGQHHCVLVLADVALAATLGEGTASMADRCYDVTERLGGFLDRHLLLPLLDFLASKGTYDAAELEQSKLEVLFGTNMVDLAIDIYTERKQEPPAAMMERREEVLGTMQSLSAEVQPILDLVQDQGRVNELKAERLFNITYLQQQMGITPHHVDVLQRYAKFVYDCGNYQQASKLLVNFRQLTCGPPLRPMRSRRRAPEPRQQGAT